MSKNTNIFGALWDLGSTLVETANDLAVELVDTSTELVEVGSDLTIQTVQEVTSSLKSMVEPENKGVAAPTNKDESLHSADDF